MVPARLLTSSSTAAAVAIMAGLIAPRSRRLLQLPEVVRDEVEPCTADLYRPARGDWPGIVLVLGAVREGRRYPMLEQAAHALAATGFAVLVPELGRLRDLVLGEDALEDLVAAASALPSTRGVRGARVGLVGFSLGGSLALLAAADPRLAGRVACVAAMGGYCDLEEMLAAATCASVAAPSAYAIAASLVSLLPKEDGALLEAALEGGPEAPLDAIRDVDPAALTEMARPTWNLLCNRDRASVPRLLAEVEGASGRMARLSPGPFVDRVTCPVWALHDERDRYVPVDQLRRLREAAAGRRIFTFLTVRLLEHTEPSAPGLDPRVVVRDYLPGLVSLFRFVRGPLRAARSQANP